MSPVASEMIAPNQTTVSQAALSFKTSFHCTAPETKRKATSPKPIALALKPVIKDVPQPISARMNPTATSSSCRPIGPIFLSSSRPMTRACGVRFNSGSMNLKVSSGSAIKQIIAGTSAARNQDPQVSSTPRPSFASCAQSGLAAIPVMKSAPVIGVN